MEENKTLIRILLSFDAMLNGWSNFSLQQNISAIELCSHLCKQHCLHTTAARIFKWIPELVPKSTHQTILIQKKMKHINPNLDADLHFSHMLPWPNKKQTFLVAAKTAVKGSSTRSVFSPVAGSASARLPGRKSPQPWRRS